MTTSLSEPRIDVTSSPSRLRGVARQALRWWLRLDVTGAHHVPSTGGVLVVANHQSHADSLALGAATARHLGFLGAEHLLHTPLLGGLLPALGLIPVDRGSADHALLDELARRLENGAALVIYPEGSRSRDGRVHRLRSGVARLAARTGAPVVPAGIVGTEHAWPVQSRPRARRGQAAVRFAPALAPPAQSPAARRGWSLELQRILGEQSGRELAPTFADVRGGA